jgi:hypothetical protein
MLDHFGISFVKKSKDPQNLAGLEKIVELMTAGGLQTVLSAEVREEIRRAVSGGAPNRAGI